MSKSLFNRITIAQETGVLHLGSFNLKFIPFEVFEKAQAKIVILNDNFITEIPEWLLSFKELVYFSIEKNSIAHFPILLCKMDSLLLDENTLIAFEQAINDVQSIIYQTSKYEKIMSDLIVVKEDLEILRNIMGIRLQLLTAKNQKYEVDIQRLAVSFLENPIKNIPVSVIELGSDAILEYNKLFPK